MCFIPWFCKKQPVPLRDGILRKAVIVGINDYPDAPLAGCRNDAFDTNKDAQEEGFDPDNIKTLLDGDATTDAIKEALYWLVSGLKAGDIILFWYSGHGAQVPKDDGTEGLDECICPVDFDWSRERMITDSDFIEIFSRIPDGVIFNWGSDSCHSGGLDRDFLPRAKNRGFWSRLYSRFFGPVIQKSKAMPVPINIANAIRRIKRRIGDRAIPKRDGLNVGFIAGCKSNQTSADTEVGGRPCGALTYYFRKNKKPDLTLLDVCAKVNADMANDGYDQEPQCDHETDRPWLRKKA